MWKQSITDQGNDHRAQRLSTCGVTVKPRLHDTTCYQTRCQTALTTGLTNGCIVYTAGCQTGFWQPCWRNIRSFNTVVKRSNRVWQPVERTVAVRSTRLSNLFDNWFENRLDVCLHDTAGCQTGLTTGCIM